MRIFVTGVAGFVGSHVAERFLSKGHEVIGVDNMLGGYADNVPKGVEFHKVDCANRDEILTLMRGSDIVYHCAATAYEGLSVFSPDIVTKNIYGITVSVLSAAIACKVKRFVHCSSMARYGTQEVPFREDMTPKPQDPYGIAKVAAEETIKNLCMVHGMEYVIAVPHNIIGPRQKYDDPYRNVASIMINRVLLGKPPIVYGDGRQMRCFSFIEDVIDPLEKLATADVSGETINIGPDEEFVTINYLAETICRLLNYKGEVIYMPGRPQEVKHATCSADKARRLLDYKTTTKLEDGLKSIIEYVKKRGPRPFDYHLPLEIITEKTPDTWKKRLM